MAWIDFFSNKIQKSIYRVGDTVYVLNQKIDDGTISTRVFVNFDSCIDQIILEIESHDREYNVLNVRKEVYEKKYYFDGATEYFVEECTLE